MDKSYDASSINIKNAEKFIPKHTLQHWNDIFMLGDIPFWVAKGTESLSILFLMT